MARGVSRAGLLWLALGMPVIAAQTHNDRTNRGQRQTSPLATAQAQFDSGDLAAADRTLLSFLSSQPDNTQALLLLGIVRLHQERFPEAEALFKRILQSDPSSPIARRNLADALLSQDRLKEAAEQYDACILANPRAVDLKVDSARVHVRLGEFDAALKLLDSIPSSQYPRSAVPVKTAAFLGLDRRQEAEAQILLARSSSETAMDLAEVFLGANLPDSAIKSLNLAAPNAQHSSRYYYLEGKALRQKGELQAAIRDFRQALAQDPKSLLSFIAMAEIYSVQGNHAQSAEMLEKARSLDPNAPPVLRHLVMEYMQGGRNGAAAEAATALAAQSTDPDDEYLLATAFLQAQQYDAAGPVLERYLGLRPKDARAMLGLGMVYLNQRSYSKAREAFEHALQAQPDFPEAEYNLGVVAMKEGQGDDAIPYFEKSLQEKSGNASGWFDLGTLYLERGKLAEAENALRKSLAADPNGIQTEYNLGLVLSKLGKSDEAKEHVQRYQQLLKEERSREEQERSKQ